MSISKSASFGAASLLAAAVFAGPALGDGLPGDGRVAARDAHPCSASGNVGFTTDYVFRGISQSDESIAVQGGIDLTCGNFYAGIWGSGIDFGDGSEVDIYGGYRFKTGRISWDAGIIYYAYPGAEDSPLELDYVELKLGASAEIWKGGTLGGTAFYSPEYTGETGSVWTTEASFSQALPDFSIFSPTVSVLVGHSEFTDDDFDDLSYTYWNAGVTLGFRERWSVDLRYWDTNGEGAADTPLGDERFVATLKYTF